MKPVLVVCILAGSHDKDTLMAARIAEFLFPACEHQLDGEPYNAYIARIKGLYHKQVLVPLRKCLDVSEVTCFLWCAIVCMHRAWYSIAGAPA